eukprot:jgi/Bigna1/73412/fgenesh1_pg.24_\
MVEMWRVIREYGVILLVAACLFSLDFVSTPEEHALEVVSHEEQHHNTKRGFEGSNKKHGNWNRDSSHSSTSNSSQSTPGNQGNGKRGGHGAAEERPHHTPSTEGVLKEKDKIFISNSTLKPPTDQMGILNYCHATAYVRNYGLNSTLQARPLVTYDTVAIAFRQNKDTFDPAHWQRGKDQEGALPFKKSQGIVLCYSGMRKENTARLPWARTQIRNLLIPLRKMFGREGITILLQQHNAQGPIEGWWRAAFQNVSANVVEFKKKDIGGLLHPEFSGIQNCGHKIVEMEKSRGFPFRYAVRMRYDLIYDMGNQNLRYWPIWEQTSVGPVLAFTEYREDHPRLNAHLSPDKVWYRPVRCEAQDLFFIARYSPKLSKSSAYQFFGDHRTVRRYPGDGYNGDKWPAALYWSLFEGGIPIHLVYQADTCMWALQHGCTYAKCCSPLLKGS